jgi:hypothetical protein
MSRREVRKVTEARKKIFLRVLSETGSRAAAAAAASPHTDGGKGGRPGYETFRDILRRDPQFALAVEQAETEALGRVEAEIVNRSFTFDERPIFDRNGNKVGVQKSSRSANQMLLRLAEKLAPETWTPRKHHEVDGRVSHEHSVTVATLEPSDVLLLDQDEQSELVRLIQKIDLLKEDVLDVKSQ